MGNTPSNQAIPHGYWKYANYTSSMYKMESTVVVSRPILWCTNTGTGTGIQHFLKKLGECESLRDLPARRRRRSSRQRQRRRGWARRTEERTRVTVKTDRVWERFRAFNPVRASWPDDVWNASELYLLG